MFRKLQRFIIACAIAFGLAGALAGPASVVTASPAEAGVMTYLKDLGSDFKRIGKGVVIGAKKLPGGMVNMVAKGMSYPVKAVSFVARKTNIDQPFTRAGRAIASVVRRR
jgi:hypothetical protein